MKKLLASLIVALAIVPFAAKADPVPETPLGAVHAHDNGDGTYEVYADGAKDNPDPLDGYAGVELDSNAQSATVQCSDEGDWNDQDADGVPDDEEEPAQGRTGCNPSP
jgi:hypothetical protein